MTSARETLGVIDHEAEQIVVAAAVQDHDSMVEVAARVTPAMLSEPHRRLIYQAALELGHRGLAITPTAVVAKARELALKDKTISKKDLVSKAVVEQFYALDLRNKNVIGHAMGVATLYPLQGCADGVRSLMGLVARQAAASEIEAELVRLLADVSARRFAEETDVYMGYDARPRLLKTLEKWNKGQASPFYWPWEAFAHAWRPPTGMLVIFGMLDGKGKTAWAEAIARFNAKRGASVVFVATEYDQEVLDMRQLGQISGTGVQTMMAGDYSPELDATLHRAVDWYEENLGSLHYVSGSGKTMAQILQKVAAMPTKPDILVLDYIQDIAMAREDRNDRNACTTNAVQLLHSFLREHGIVGVMTSQCQKVTHQKVAVIEDMTRDFLLMPSAAFSKGQFTALGYRQKLKYDGHDPVWDAKTGLLGPGGCGFKGNDSRVMYINVDKTSFGDPFYTVLEFGKAQRVLDIPTLAREALLGRGLPTD